MSKVDILFILSPSWDIHFPPLGISYLSSYLKVKGYIVKVFDMNIELYHQMSDKVKRRWLMDNPNYWTDEILFHQIIDICDSQLDTYVDRILSNDSRIVGFSVYDSNRLFAIEIAKRIKKKRQDTFVIFGGPGCCNEEKRSRISSGVVNTIVVGEAEEALLNIVLQTSSVNMRSLPRLVSHPPILDIDSIPFPTFDEFNLQFYIEQNTLPILMNRGCIGRCTFCNDYYLCRPFRVRSAENIVIEIKEHTKKYGVTNFGFQDLAINGNVEILDSFCELLIKQGINITWTAQAIPYAKMTKNLLKKMHMAGGTVLVYGLESASNKILRRMGKFFTNEIAQKVIRNTHKAGIKVFINIIVGFPGETKNDFKETINFIKDNQKYIDTISSLNTCCINNDTELEYRCDDYNVIIPDDPRIRALYWRQKDGTDYTERRQRTQDLLLLLRDLNIPVNQTNLYATTDI